MRKVKYIMDALLHKNKEILDKSYNFCFNELSREKVFDYVMRYKNNPTTLNLQLAIGLILSWGDYESVVSRYNKIDLSAVVKKYINDEYATRFYDFFVCKLEHLSAKECFELFLGELKIENINYAYFTKIIYFFSSRKNGLVILDKQLALNSMKLAVFYKDQYAIKWYNILTPAGDYKYNAVKSNTYQDYIDFMKRATAKLGLQFVDELETLLFGWRRQLNKQFIGYNNPRSEVFTDVSFIDSAKPAVKKETRKQISNKAQAKSVSNNLTMSKMELFEKFLNLKPTGTMEFARDLGYAVGTIEYNYVYRTINNILKTMQEGSSCKTFFNETFPAIRSGKITIKNDYVSCVLNKA